MVAMMAPTATAPPLRPIWQRSFRSEITRLRIRNRPSTGLGRRISDSVSGLEVRLQHLPSPSSSSCRVGVEPLKGQRRRRRRKNAEEMVARATRRMMPANRGGEPAGFGVATGRVTGGLGAVVGVAVVARVPLKMYIWPLALSPTTRVDPSWER